MTGNNTTEPCFRCGGEIEVSETNDAVELWHWACSDCKIHSVDALWSIQECVADANRRAPLPDVAGDVEELCAICGTPWPCRFIELGGGGNAHILSTKIVQTDWKIERALSVVDYGIKHVCTNDPVGFCMTCDFVEKTKEIASVYRSLSKRVEPEELVDAIRAVNRLPEYASENTFENDTFNIMSSTEDMVNLMIAVESFPVILRALSERTEDLRSTRALLLTHEEELAKMREALRDARPYVASHVLLYAGAGAKNKQSRQAEKDLSAVDAALTTNDRTIT